MASSRAQYTGGAPVLCSPPGMAENVDMDWQRSGQGVAACMARPASGPAGRSRWRATLAGFAALVLLAGCSLLEPEPLEPPAVSLRGLEPEAFGINSQVFRARLGLFNPNTVPLKISRGELELELAGVGAARGRTLGPVEVPAGAEVETDIRVTTHLLRDGPALLRALPGGSLEQGLAYTLQGHVYVERRGLDRVPISASGRLGPPAAPAGQAAPGRSEPRPAL